MAHRKQCKMWERVGKATEPCCSASREKERDSNRYDSRSQDVNGRRPTPKELCPRRQVGGKRDIAEGMYMRLLAWLCSQR
jgi:hypothetical protein